MWCILADPWLSQLSVPGTFQIQGTGATLLYVTLTTIQSRPDLSRKSRYAGQTAKLDVTELEGNRGKRGWGIKLEHFYGPPGIGGTLVPDQGQEMAFTVVGPVLLQVASIRFRAPQADRLAMLQEVLGVLSYSDALQVTEYPVDRHQVLLPSGFRLTVLLQLFQSDAFLGKEPATPQPD